MVVENRKFGVNHFVFGLGVEGSGEDGSHESERNAVEEEHGEIPGSGVCDRAIGQVEWDGTKNDASDDCESSDR
jgi:hypothetical protein